MQENDYSQVVVFTGEEYGILSSESIVSWLGECCEDGLADIEGSMIENAYSLENPESFLHMSRSETVESAVLEFENVFSKGLARLHAILVTHSGKPNETPIGIITPWDVVGFIREYDTLLSN